MITHAYNGLDELVEPDDDQQTDQHGRIWTRRGIGGDVVVWERDQDPDAYAWTLVVDHHGPMAPVRTLPVDSGPTLPVAAIREVLDSIADAACSFRFCKGPDASLVGMQTCNVCGPVIELRALVRAAESAAPNHRDEVTTT